MSKGEQFERQIHSQPGELRRLLTSGSVHEQVHAAAQGLHRAHRIWLVGSGSSLHVAELAAAMLQEAGRAAQAVSSMHFVDFAPVVGPQDAVVVITHSSETAYALAARAVAFSAGLDVVMITRRGAGFPDSIETVDRDTSQTGTVGYTAALLAAAMLAQQMGAQSFAPDTLVDVPEAVAAAIDGPGLDDVSADARVVALTGAGPAAVTAREGAVKLRGGARKLAEGYDAETILHGSAAPLRPGDHLVTLTPPDAGGFPSMLGAAARAEGIGVTDLHEPWPMHPILAQLPLTARLQMLALRLSRARGVDPDTVTTGAWADARLWGHGRPPG
jgi:glucosamine--fructose-6-phosphate aminotransferase (isomerizing)